MVKNLKRIDIMWILYAFGSAFFAGITAVLAKCGIQKTDSTVVTAVRTIIVIVFAWLMVFIVGSQDSIAYIDGKTLLFLILSGIATGASWLCYFKALQLGEVNKVAPIDKFSTVLTIFLALLILREPLTFIKAIGIATITIGTYLMIQKTEFDDDQVKNNAWLIYALLSALFASFTAILGKIGISNIESNLGTAIRTIVVLIMAWLMVFVTNKQDEIKNIAKSDLIFICLSGIATGASWLCYFKALQTGPASVVVPIDKLSIVVTIIFSRFVLKESLSKRALAGLACVVAGTLAMLM